MRNVLHHQATRFVGLEEPLVRIQPDRVSALDPAQEPFTPLRDDRKAAVRGIDMQPEPFRRAEVGHLLEPVDGSRAHRAGIGGDRDGTEAGVAVGGHRASERIHVHAKVRVARDHADALAADAHDHRRTEERAVALVAHVDRGAFGVARRLPRRDECVDARGRAPAGKEAARALRIAEPLPKPVDDDQLELTRAARDQPGALVDVVAGGHEVGHHTGPGGRRRDESEEAGGDSLRAVSGRMSRAAFSITSAAGRPSSGGSSSIWSSSNCRNSPSQAFSAGSRSIRSTTSSSALCPRRSICSRDIRRSPAAGTPGSVSGLVIHRT